MKKNHLIMTAYGILFLFLIQMTATLVESVYIMDLLNTALDEKALGILFLLSPVLLLLFRRKHARWLLWLSCGLLVIARGITPYFNTLGRLVSSGIGTGAAFILLPIMLASSPDLGEGEERRAPAQGLALAVGLSVLFRTLNYTVDISMTRGYEWIGWILAAPLCCLLPQFVSGAKKERDGEHKGIVTAAIGTATSGTVTILGLVYFAFSSPGVIARWTEGNYQFIVITVSFMSLLWLVLSLWKPALLGGLKSQIVNVWNILFLLSLCGTILAHTVRFPSSPDSPAVVVTSPLWWQQVPMVLMLMLLPIIFIDFSVLAGVVVRARPSPRRLAPGFLLGSFFLLILVFVNIFTNVWGYVEPVSTYFRNLYWLPFLLISAVATAVTALHLKKRTPIATRTATHREILVPAIAACVILAGTVVSALLTDSGFRTGEDKRSLTIMTYNIQQGNDERGEKALEEQITLIRKVNPDLVGLQECDSARISIGNTDLVRYYANKLGYYSYYGPKTVTGSFGTAILSRYPLVNSLSFFTFSDQDENGTAQVEIEVGGVRFTVFNVHPDGSDAAKWALVETVLERAADKERVIALGDYNLREGDEAYSLIDAVYRNAWMDAYPTGIDDDGLDMSGRKRIDHVFVSPRLAVRNPVYLLAPESWTDHPAHWTEIHWD